MNLVHYLLVLWVIGINFSLVGVYVITRMRGAWVVTRGNLKAYTAYRRIYRALSEQFPDAKHEELLIRDKQSRLTHSNKQRKEPDDVDTANDDTESEEKK